MSSLKRGVAQPFRFSFLHAVALAVLCNCICFDLE
jgi:hypothetical protein